jgi:putative transport protein
MDVLRTLLESSPLLALFLAIASGYALGQLSIAGVSFGAGAVLFTGLILGALAPGASPPAVIGTLGLVMFVYGVGIQYGAQFFAGLRGPGAGYTTLAVVAVLASLAVAVLLADPLGISLAVAADLFSGAATNTPSLQASIAAAGDAEQRAHVSGIISSSFVGTTHADTRLCALDILGPCAAFAAATW